MVQRYSLPHLTAEGQHLLRCRPYMLALNCNLTRMSIIDINGVLTFYDLNAKAGPGVSQGEHLAFERKVGGGARVCTPLPCAALVRKVGPPPSLPECVSRGWCMSSIQDPRGCSIPSFGSVMWI